MEYIVSARKYRPMTFDSVVGQGTIATTLKNAVKSGKLAHAYLFSGPRGVGKTTCARIFAKAINCFNPTADGEACGECESCASFNEQRSLNIFELDAASNNGIEHIKSLIDQTRVPPQIGKYKVFIIDEVHQLSTAAFNAFLKTLEEPPAHVIFILATTEKQKLLPTIISRCQLYDFERMRVPDMVAHLKHVAEQEGYAYEEEALQLIAEKADGGMRDALSIFDQTASYCQGNITYEKVVEDLNVLDVDNYFRLVDYALDNKVSEMMLLFDHVLSKGFDGGQLISGLANHIRYVMMAKDKQTTGLIDKSESLRQRYHEQAQRTQPQFLYSALRILNDCDLNYRQSGNKRLLAELTLIEMAQLTQSEDDPPGGRRPKHRLKSLFSKLTASTPSSAGRQVAHTERNDGREEQNHERREKKAETDTQHSTEGECEKKMRGEEREKRSEEGVEKKAKQTTLQRSVQSFSTLLKSDDDEVVEDTTLIVPEEQVSFTQQQLQEQWNAMCVRMNESQPGLATRLRNVTPQVADNFNVLLVLPNNELLQQVRRVKKRITKTLQLALRNNAVSLTETVDLQKYNSSVLTNQEYMKHLTDTYPLFVKMCQHLQLEQV